MKKLQRLLCFAVIAVMLFAFVSCDTQNNDEKPATPQNVKISDTGLITWDAVPNAVGYVVTINGKNNRTDKNSYQVASTEETFTYSVMSLDESFTMSDPTETYTFIGVGPIIPTPDLSGVTVAISGESEVKSGKTLQLAAVVEGADDKTVTWKVTKGTDAVSIDQNGLVTAKEISADVIVEIEARSNANSQKFATKQLSVVSKAVLTQQMLDDISLDKIAFDGYITINVYSVGPFSKLENSYSMLVSTKLDGKHWYAEYENSIGTKSEVYCSEHNGFASLVGLNYKNQELYEPMTDDFGKQVTWEASGYYNNFKGLKVSDFTFNEDSWRYEFNGDVSVAERMIASANPYNFKAEGFSLILSDGEIMGIYAKSGDDYSIVSGKRCIQELTMAVHADNSIDVPTIGKYSTEDIHSQLAVAIDNMQKLSSYTTDVLVTNYSIYTSSYSQEGYVETVTEDVCHFVPYVVSYAQDMSEIRTFDNSASYGYRKISQNLYNSYHNDGKNNFVASRAFSASFENSKPSFEFAAEIFRGYHELTDSETGEKTGEIIYQVDSPMTGVAATMYKGVGNDIALYGIFASDTVSMWDYDVEATYVTVKDGYITDVYFWYDMYYMYGFVTISFSNFNTATLAEDVSFDGYEARQIPTLWSQLETETEQGEWISAEKFIADLLGAETVVPFFGDALGDTYGFVMETVHIASDDLAHTAALFYYDVPLDADYTIESSLKAMDEFLLSQGFVKNARGEYNKGNLWVTPVDNDLDFIIYVWTV